MKEAAELEKYTRQQIKEANEKVDDRISKLEKSIKEQIRKLTTQHLEKKDFIGSGDKCKYPTLMEFSLARDEKTTKENHKIKDNATKL